MISPAPRTDGFRQADMNLFTAKPGDARLLRHAKEAVTGILAACISGKKTTLETVESLCSMAMTIGRYDQRNELYPMEAAFPVIEPVLQLVQAQYGNEDQAVGQRARLKVGSAMHYRGVASNISGATLCNGGFLDVVNADAQRVLQKRHALRGWIEKHKDQPEEIAIVEQAIDDRLADFKRQSAEALAELDPEDPAAELERLEARDMFADEAGIYREWKAMLRPPEPVA